MEHDVWEKRCNRNHAAVQSRCFATIQLIVWCRLGRNGVLAANVVVVAKNLGGVKFSSNQRLEEHRAHAFTVKLNLATSTHVIVKIANLERGVGGVLVQCPAGLGSKTECVR